MTSPLDQSQSHRYVNLPEVPVLIVCARAQLLTIIILFTALLNFSILPYPSPLLPLIALQAEI